MRASVCCLSALAASLAAGALAVSAEAAGAAKTNAPLASSAAQRPLGGANS